MSPQLPTDPADLPSSHAQIDSTFRESQPASSRPWIQSYAWRLCLVLGLIATGGYFFWPTQGAQNIHLAPVNLMPVVAIALGVRWHRPARALPWYLIAAGLLMWVAGSIAWASYNLIWGTAAPLPSIADALFLLYYPLIGSGLMLLARGRTGGKDRSSVIDALIVTTSLAVLSWIFLIDRYIEDQTLTFLQRLVSISYPLMDVLLLAVAARFLLAPGRRSLSFLTLGATLIITVTTDTVYAFSLLNGTYTTGHPLNAGWMLAYTLWCVAALHPSMRTLGESTTGAEKRLTRSRLALLAGASLLGPLVYAIQTLREAQTQVPVIIGGSVVLFLLVLSRMVGIVRRHEQAIERETILRTAGTALVASVDRESIYATAFDAARAMIHGCSGATFRMLEGTDGYLSDVTFDHGQMSRCARRGLNLGNLPPSIFASLQAGESVIMTHDLDIALGDELELDSQARAVFIAPLLAAGDIRGAILVASRESLPIEARTALQSLAAKLALAIQRAHLSDALLMRQSEERFRALVQHSSDLIMINDADGTIRYLTPSVERVLGYQPAALSGATLTHLIHPDDLPRAQQLFDAASRQPGVSAPVEWRMRHANDSWIDVEAISNSLLHDPKIKGIVLTIRDVSDRKKIERMKSEFISTVSHELRTPLTSIRGSLGLIAGGVAGELPARAKAMIDIAYNNSERLVRLINDILDMEKIESGKMVFDLKPLELIPLIEQTIEANRSYGEQYGVTFVLEQRAPNVKVNADSDRLIQALTNLLSNAAKFSPRDDVVRVSVEAHESRVRVAVSDHGSGISEEFRSRIFQKFAQADSSDTRQKGGTGLGLSITKAIVEKHGGQIDFDTSSHSGTTFFFDLPIWHDPELTIDHDSPSGESRILICEDDPDVAMLLSMMLQQGGFETDIVYTAAAAKQLLASRDYLGMTLDLMLPGQDGISLIRELRAQEDTRDLPIIIVSAKAEQGRAELNGDAVGIVDWLEKPIDPTQLLAAVREAEHHSLDSQPHILHIEDDPDVRQVVAAILANVADTSFAATIQEAVERLKHETFDVLILDLGLPDGNGLKLLPFLQQQNPPIPVVVFSAHELEHETAHGIITTLVKSRTSNQEILDTIVALLQRRHVVSHP